MYEYLAEEVFNEQEAEVRIFLKASSILESIDPGLSDGSGLQRVNRSAANWKFIKKVVELILSLEGDSYSEEASPAI